MRRCGQRLSSILLLLITAVGCEEDLGGEERENQELSARSIIEINDENIEEFNSSVADYCSRCGDRLGLSICDGSLISTISMADAECIARETNPDELRIIQDRLNCQTVTYRCSPELPRNRYSL